MNPISAFRKENLIGIDSRAVSDLLKMLSTDPISIRMEDRNMLGDSSESEIHVFGRGSGVQPVTFGVLSEVPAWVEIWSGSCKIDDCYLDRDSNKAVLAALAQRVQVLREKKAALLLSELQRRVTLARSGEESGEMDEPSLLTLLQQGSKISISNNYSNAPDTIDCPIFLNLDQESSRKLGIEGLQGFYNRKVDRVVITDGTFLRTPD